MSETITMDSLRGLLAGLASAGTQEVSTLQLADILGLATEPEKVRLRRRLQQLLSQREVQRVRDGVWRWVGLLSRAKTHEVYSRLWRAVRASKPGYDVQTLATVANACGKIARSYLDWLESEGFVERYGQGAVSGGRGGRGGPGNGARWRTAALGRETRSTPFPPKPQADPFAVEKNAAMNILSEMLTAGDDGLAQIGRRRRICANARAILARFEAPEPDQELETEASHDQGQAATHATDLPAPLEAGQRAHQSAALCSSA